MSAPPRGLESRFEETEVREAVDISVLPADKQVVAHEGRRYTTVKEGLAHILVPLQHESGTKKRTLKVGGQESGDDQLAQQVFYNPIQQFNRDLTVLAIKAYGQERIEQKQAAALLRRDNFLERKKKRKAVHEVLQDGRPNKARKTDSGQVAVVGREGGEVKNYQPPLLDASAETDEPDVETRGEASKIIHAPSFVILDALSASGLRALRYAHEIPFVTSVTANDVVQMAVEMIKLNTKHNRLEAKINASHDDAVAHMYTLIAKELRRGPDVAGKRGSPKKSDKYDVVDLDPYGTAAPFLDAAVQAVRDDGGLLCVTCTDAGVWASNGYPEKCYSLYGGVPVKGFWSHEAGLRIILHAIESSAARYGLATEPLLSLSIDFYARFFVRLRRSPASVKFQGGRNMLVYNCDQGCGAWVTQPLMRNKPADNKKGTGQFYKHVFAQGPSVDRLCEHCGSKMHVGGPMYAGKIHSAAFIRQVLAEVEAADETVYGTKERMRGVLHTAVEEMMTTRGEDDARRPGAATDKAQTTSRTAKVEKGAALVETEPFPFYFRLDDLAKVIHTTSPPGNALRGALIGLGYRVTRSHCKAGSIKTDAPWPVMWHVMKEWARQKAPVKETKLKEFTAGYRLLGLGKKQKKEEVQEGGDEHQSKKGKTAENNNNAASGGMPEVVFDEQLGKTKNPPGGKLVRYQTNPREDWGPLARAKGMQAE